MIGLRRVRTVLLTGVAPLAFLASAAAAQTPSDANIVAGAVTVTLNSTPVTASGSFSTGGAAGALALEITATPTLLNWTSGLNLAAGSTISFAKASGGPDFVLTNRLLAGGTNLVNGTITAQGRVQFLTGGSTLSFGTTGVFNGTTLLASTLGATDSNITAGGALTLTGTDSGASLSLRTGTLSNSTNNLPVLSAITNSGAITIDSTTITNSGGSAPGISATSTTGNITVTSGTVTSTSTTLPNASVASEGILAQTGGTIQITSGTVTNSGPTASAIAAIGGAGVQINSTSATTSGGNSTAIFAKSANGNISVTSGTLTVSGTGGNGIGATADNGTVTIASTTISVAGNDAQAFGLQGVGKSGVTITSGTVSSGSTGIIGISSGGATSITTTGDTTSRFARAIAATGATVSVTTAAAKTASGATDGLLVRATTSGTLTNSGTVSGTSGAGVLNDAAGTLTITNNSGATISGGTSGIVAGAGAVAVTNSGTIRGNGTYDGLDRLPDAGIIVAAGGTTITNSGTISGRSQGIGTALYFNPSTSQLEARAIGTTVTNLSGGTILGELTNAIRLVGGGTITNAGAITSQGASGISMFAFTGQTLNGLTSIGTVTNQAGGTITGTTRGIVLTGGGVVSNAGTITGGAAAGDGSNAAIIIQALSTQPGKTGTITNTGTLTGFRGILLASALSSAEITNSATITGQGNAGIQNDSAGLATITNQTAGTITGATSGIVANAGAVAVANSGTIRGNGTYDGLERPLDAGVYITQAGSSVTNSGTISGAGLGIATGFYFNPAANRLEGRAIGTTVTNNAGGTIRGEGTNAIRLIGGGTVTNSGTITAFGASGVAMFAFDGQDLTGKPSIGTVTNQAGGTITGGTRGIVLTGGGVVSNAGTITGGAAAGDGSNAAIIIQALSTQPGKTGTITNTGTLTGFRGVLLASALSSSEITNSATITGQGNAGIQNDSAGLATIRNEFGASITGVTSGVVANGGAVAITNAGTIRGTGTYDGFDRAPDGGVVIAAAGSSVTNSGTISGARFGITTASFFNAAANRLEGRAIGTSVVNSAGATIQGDTDDGVRLIGGGTVTNSGIIRGAAQNPTATTDGVSMFGFDGQTPAAGQTTLGSVSNLIGGQIVGQRHGILLTGGGSVTNGGTISGGNTAVFIQALSTEAGRTAAITNSGTLTGASGVTVGGAIASSTLTNSATITGTSAVGVTNGGAGAMTMSNTLTGRITGATSGVLASTAGIVLTNAGTIRGNGTFDGLDRTPDAGVMVTAAGTVITNTGTISGAAQGIGTAMLFNPSTSRLEALAIGTEVINRSTGTIRGEATNAIRLVGGGAVTNAGTITSQGASAISMFAFEGQNLTGRTSIGTVTNQIGGRITGLTRGIVLTGGGVVSNAGTITGGSTAGDGSNAAIIIQGLSTQPASTATISNSGTLLGFRGVFLAATLASGSLTNSASITGQGSSGVQNDSSGVLTITNQGFGAISGATSGIVAGAGAIALTNAGNIRGNGTSAGSGTQAPDAGVLVTQAGSSITNSGTISGNQSGVATAPLFVAGVAQARATNTVVSNSGSIIGDNDDGVRLLGGGSVTNSGTIRGTAGSQTDGVQMSNLAGQTTTGQAELGSVTNERTGIIDGQRWGVFLIGGGTVTNDGTISGAKLASATGGVGGVLIATGTGQTGKSATLTNSGTINGLVELTTSRNTLSNSGTIAGAVNLGTGAEGSVGSSVLNNRGVINGAVTFGAGDDVYNFFSGAQQNGIANGGGGTNTLALQLGVATSQRLDGSQFINFQRLEQLSQGSITLFFSGAVTFSNIGASNGGTVNLDSGTVQNVSLGTGSTATLGSSATVATTTDGATAVSVTGASSTISSSGTIQASGSGTTAVALSGSTSNFTNGGTVTASGSGATAVAASGDSTTVANTGTVAATGDGATAVAASGTSTTVANTGTIQVSGSNSTAVNLAGTSTTITSAPGATIATTGDNSTAIAVSGTSATVANSPGATITTTGDNSVGVAVTSTQATVQNDGTLATAGANSDAVSVSGSGSTINNTSNNTIRTSGANSNGVTIRGNANTVNNTGTIRVADAGAAAIAVTAAAGTSNQIINSAAGTIIATGDAVRGGAGDVVLVNAGVLTGNVRLGAGNDTVTLAATSAFTGTIDGGAGTNRLIQDIGAAGGTMAAATNFQFYSKTGSGTLRVARDTAGYANVAVAEGRLLLADATLTAATTIGAGGRLGGNGRIAGSLTAAGTVAPGNSIGTINVTGPVSFGAGAIYEVETNADGRSDRIVATGAATLTGGTVAVIPEAGTYGKTTDFTILTAASVTGQFAGATSSNAGLVPFLSYGATGVTLTLARPDLSFGGIAESANQRAVANAAEARGRGNAFYDALLRLPTIAAGRAGFDALSGEVHASTTAALVLQARQLRGALLGRAMSAEGEGAAIWGQASDGAMEVSASPALGAVAADHKRVTTGFDYGGAAWRLGVSAGLSKTDLQMTGRASSADIDGKSLGVFVRSDLGRLSLSSGATFEWHDVATTRTIAIAGLAGTPVSSSDATTRQLFSEAAYRLTDGTLRVTPFIGFAQVRVKADALTETGATAALAVSRQTRDVGTATLGLRASGTMATAGSATLLPNLSMAWRKSWGDRAEARGIGFAGTAGRFAIEGQPTGRSGFDLAAGLTADLGRGIRIGAAGELSSSGEWSETAAKLSFSWAF